METQKEKQELVRLWLHLSARLMLAGFSLNRLKAELEDIEENTKEKLNHET